MSEEPSLLEEFRKTPFRSSGCQVCTTVPDDVRAVVEDGIRRGVGPKAIIDWLRDHGREWPWSDSPIKTHKGHLR